MVPKFKIMEKNMKKRTLIEIILGNVGGLLLAIGMCMIFIPNWNLSATGVALTIFGGINLLAIIPIHIKGPHKSRIYNWKRIILKIIVITIALIIGYGIGEIIARKNMILGVVIWVIGLMISILSYPTYEYYKVDKKKLLKTALGTIGSIMLAVGMSMTFIRYWNLTLYGTIIGLIGAALLVFFVYLNKKNNEDFLYIKITDNYKRRRGIYYKLDKKYKDFSIYEIDNKTFLKLKNGLDLLNENISQTFFSCQVEKDLKENDIFKYKAIETYPSLYIAEYTKKFDYQAYKSIYKEYLRLLKTSNSENDNSDKYIEIGSYLMNMLIPEKEFREH